MNYSQNILGTIGNTPMVKLNSIVKEIPATVLAKIEFFNPGNSIKDRMAIKMVEDAEKSGALKPGGTIIEGTSGNTGMGLAIAAIIKGYKCIFTTTDKQSKEKVRGRNRNRNRRKSRKRNRKSNRKRRKRRNRNRKRKRNRKGNRNMNK